MNFRKKKGLPPNKCHMVPQWLNKSLNNVLLNSRARAYKRLS